MSSPRWPAVAAMLLRPFVIVGGSAAALFAVLALAPIDLEAEFAPDRLRHAFGLTLEAAIAGTLAGLLLSAPFGLVARLSPALDRLIGILSIPAASLLPPVTTITLVYWLAIRFDLLPAIGWIPFSDHRGDHLRSMIIPTLVVGLAVAPALARMIRDVGRSETERWPQLGHEAVTAQLAERAGGRADWVAGFPLITLGIALASTEITQNRPGLFSLILSGAMRFDVGGVLTVGVLLAVGTAFAAFLLDGAALLREPAPKARVLASDSARATTSSTGPIVVLLLGTAWLGSVSLLGVIDLALDEPSFDIGAVQGGLLSEGHPLGIDAQGRDQLRRIAAGAVKTLAAAVIPAVLATAMGAGAAGLATLVRPYDEPLIGLPVDLLSWPMMAILVAWVFADGFGDSVDLGSLLLLGAVLAPVATRTLRRSFHHTAGIGRLWATLGTASLVAAIALSAGTLMSFTGLLGGPDAWGAQFASASSNLIDRPGPTAALGTMMVVTALALHGIGAGLVQLASTAGATASAPGATEDRSPRSTTPKPTLSA